MQETNVIEQRKPVEPTDTEIPVPAPTMTLCSYGNKLIREELAQAKTPAGTATHKPIPGRGFSRHEGLSSDGFLRQRAAREKDLPNLAKPN